MRVGAQMYVDASMAILRLHRTQENVKKVLRHHGMLEESDAEDSDSKDTDSKDTDSKDAA